MGGVVYRVSERLTLAEWEGVLLSLQETLEDVLENIKLAKQEGIRSDIMALDAFDELDKFLSGVKADLGV